MLKLCSKIEYHVERLSKHGERKNVEICINTKRLTISKEHTWNPLKYVDKCWKIMFCSNVLTLIKETYIDIYVDI